MIKFKPRAVIAQDPETGHLFWQIEDHVAQSCGYEQAVGSPHWLYPEFTCVEYTPPSDCMGGFVVYRAPFKGTITIEE